MRIISLLIAFCFSLNVMASTGTIQELEKHLDDYQYALTVDWDQKDEAFYNAKTKDFFEKIGKLIKEDGLSQEQVMKLVETKMNNKEALNALKLKLNVLSKGASQEELANIVKESAKDLYAKGASWNGEVVIGVAVLAVFVGLIAYSVWWDANHECVAWEEQYVCNTYNNCYYSGGYYGGSYYGGGYYGNGGYCYGPATTYCGYTDVCTEYQRKD